MDGEEMTINDKTVLITGGTGSFGQKFVEIALRDHNPEKIIVLSRDELKQFDMQQMFNKDSRLRFFLGDVRDRERLYRAFKDVDIVIHAAALKQIPAAEYNPFEVIKTNVIGAQNIIEAAIDCNIEKVIALSTDKAANPINLYGATKLCSDKLFVAGNSYSPHQETNFSVVRYGNVVGSRGSVIPFFMEQRCNGKLPITDPRMTRFWITLEQGVRFVLQCLENMVRGEIFVPKLPSTKVTDLAVAIAPECELEVVGIRPGEKLHEVMITEEDARRSVEFDHHFVITPNFGWWKKDNCNGGKPLPDGFVYSSDRNDWWLTKDEVKKMISNLNNV